MCFAFLNSQPYVNGVCRLISTVGIENLECEYGARARDKMCILTVQSTNFTPCVFECNFATQAQKGPTLCNDVTMLILSCCNH